MLEVAIISLKCAMREEEPEFMAFYEARSWEPKPEPKASPEEAEPSASLFVESQNEQLPKQKADGADELADLTVTEEK